MATATVVAALGCGLTAAAGELPPDFEQILPRGRIASIDTPTFVNASVADIDPESWVLGVVVERVAKAYSLKLLNSHEVVNDRTGSTPYAAVW